MNAIEIIRIWKINMTMLSKKTGIPLGTFKAKIGDFRPGYNFTPEEEKKLLKALNELSDLIINIPNNKKIAMHYTQITSLEIACGVNGTNPLEILPYNKPVEELTPKQAWLNSVAFLDEVATAMKAGLPLLDYGNRSQEKWEAVFVCTKKEDGPSGFAFSDALSYFNRTYAGVGARLSFHDRAMCKHFGKTFIDQINIFLTNQNPS